MSFTHDTEVSLQGAAALVNTMPGTLPGEEQEEALETVADLRDYYSQWQWTGRHDGTRAELEAVRELRPRIRGFWERDDAGAADLANELLAECTALPQVVRHDDFGWHIHATPREAPLATRMAVEAALAVVDLLRADDLSRLKVCDRHDCDDVFVDLSRNRSKRYCDEICGNRQAASDYRARQAATGEG